MGEHHKEAVLLVKPVSIRGSKRSRTANGRAKLEAKEKENVNHWRQHLVTFEQYQHESDLEASGPQVRLLIHEEQHSRDWKLWLELILFRKRHHGSQGTQALYKEVFRRGVPMPCNGNDAKHLWGMLILAGAQDSKFWPQIISYAIEIKQTTGKAWPKTYYSIVNQTMKTDPTLAYKFHIRLKEHFPPSLSDYWKLFERSTVWDSVDGFERLYRDFPLPGMYALVIAELCRLQRYRDAIKWHYLLIAHKDMPQSFNDFQPLLAYLVLTGEAGQIENLIRDMKETLGLVPSVPSLAETLVKRPVFNRESFNRHLGKVHGVTPKHLSDNFCARVFATRLFSMETIISGLQMMAVESIGPLSMRELALRDECNTSDVCRHLDRLKEAGASPDESTYSSLFQKLALNGQRSLLTSLVESDLHPDTLDDCDLQERLLAQYYDNDDQLQVERTLATVTLRCRGEALERWRWNYMLRSHITLRRTEAVMSMLEIMKQKDIPITTRTSRHMRVTWLSKRNVGRAAESTRELSIIINASRSTLLSGRDVPLMAWREFMRRLGMAGRLEEFKNLALWLVDHYTIYPAPKSLLEQALTSQGQPSHHSDSERPQYFLNDIFTTAAQQAIVAWGFQQEVKLPEVKQKYADPIKYYPKSLLWMWGLVLLKELQARGVPIDQRAVARTCLHRLRQLFGSEISNRRINRRSRWLSLRTRPHRQSALKIYIRDMKSIWGQDLFKRDPGLELSRSGGPVDIQT